MGRVAGIGAKRGAVHQMSIQMFCFGILAYIIVYSSIL